MEFSTKIRLLFALVLTVAVYATAMGFGFVYDDQPQIVDNPAIRSWSHVSEYFTNHVWEGVFPGGGSHYRPVFLLWLRVLYAVFGLAPRGWHVASLLLHLATTLLVFHLSQRWTGDSR